MREVHRSSIVALVAEAFLSRLAFGIVAFALPLYARSLGIDITTIAVLISLNTAIAIVLKAYAGRLADRFGYKSTAVTAVVGRSLLTGALAFAATPVHLFAVQATRGIAKALRDPAMAALVAEHGGKRRIAAAFAWYKTATSAAGGLGKASAGVLLTLTAANYPLVFGAAFLVSLSPLLPLIWLVPHSSPQRSDATTPIKSQDQHRDRPAPSLWPFMGLGFLISSTAHMLRSLFPILAVEYGGLTEAQTGVLYLLATAVTLAAGPLFGWLSDRVSRSLVLATRSVANVVSSALYLVFPSFAGFAVAKAVDEAGKAAFNPAWGSLMAELSARDPKGRGRTMGHLDAADDAGSVLGPILASAIWSLWGIGALLVARIGLAVVTEVYAFFLLRQPLSPQERPSTRLRASS